MDAIEKRARDILGSHVEGYWLEGQGKCVLVEEAVNAIISALTPPEGYVLVPVELTDEMVKAVYPLHYFTHLGPELRENWRRMLTARPEVPNVND